MKSSPAKKSSYVTSFINAEFGIQTNDYDKMNKDFFSMGVGYKLTTKVQLTRDSSMDQNMYKLFFNYSLTKRIVLQPELVINFKRKEKYNGWLGMAINFQLF